MTNPVNIPALAHAAHPVVQIENGQAITLSTEVARVFDKRHDHVLDSIRSLIAQLPSENRPNFREVITEYQNGKGGTQTSPAYHLTRDGFTLLAFGFTGKKAMAFKIAYIDAFNKMQAQLAAKAPARLPAPACSATSTTKPTRSSPAVPRTTTRPPPLWR